MQNMWKTDVVCKNNHLAIHREDTTNSYCLQGQCISQIPLKLVAVFLQTLMDCRPGLSWPTEIHNMQQQKACSTKQNAKYPLPSFSWNLMLMLWKSRLRHEWSASWLEKKEVLNIIFKTMYHHTKHYFAFLP